MHRMHRACAFAWFICAAYLVLGHKMPMTMMMVLPPHMCHKYATRSPTIVHRGEERQMENDALMPTGHNGGGEGALSFALTVHKWCTFAVEVCIESLYICHLYNRTSLSLYFSSHQHMHTISSNHNATRETHTISVKGIRLRSLARCVPPNTQSVYTIMCIICINNNSLRLHGAALAARCRQAMHARDPLTCVDCVPSCLHKCVVLTIINCHCHRRRCGTNTKTAIRHALRAHNEHLRNLVWNGGAGRPHCMCMGTLQTQMPFRQFALGGGGGGKRNVFGVNKTYRGVIMLHADVPNSAIITPARGLQRRI